MVHSGSVTRAQVEISMYRSECALVWIRWRNRKERAKMITLTLEPQYEDVWLGNNPSPATFPPGQPPLLHQQRTYHAEQPLIVNTYNTGTGKTKAALLRLLKRARDKGFHLLDSTEDNALLIAPTNELLAQHANDADQFCQENDLPYRVVPITRAHLGGYKEQG